MQISFYIKKSIATLLFLKLFIQEIGLNVFKIFKANRNSPYTLQINKIQILKKERK